jgi:hypothetical protein
VIRVSFIEHRGKRIAYHDFSNVGTLQEATEAFRQSAELVRAQPQGSVLTLTNVEGSRFNKDILDGLKTLTAGNKPYVKAACIVGLSGLQRVAYLAVTTFTGRHMPTFATADKAKDWLVEQT